MKLSDESKAKRLGILLPVWLILAVLFVLHALYVREYLEISGSLGLRGSPAPTTPLRAMYPGFAADAHVWVRHSLSLLEGDAVRLRQTDIDNAPFGREVHWNSAWAWAIAGAGKLDHWVNGTPLPQAVERMTLWLPILALWCCVVGLSWWTASRGGVLAGLFVAIALGGHPRFYEGFFPAYVDHHGLITVSVFALVLGASFMGAGWWRELGADGRRPILPTSPAEARGAAVFSGLGGAFGMWIGAASVIPTIAFVGFAGVLTLVVLGQKALAQGDRFDPECWRWWGRSGALGSLFFYLLEYFPHQMGFRLEVNHPFYALAWWGAGELIADGAHWWLGGRQTSAVKWSRVALAGAAVAVAPLTILLGGTRVFVVADPFLANLHKFHIQEFLPLWKSLSRMGWPSIIEVVVFENIPLLVGLGFLITKGRRSVFIWFILTVAVLAISLAWWQSRWLLNATGPQVCLALGVLGILLAGSRPSVRWLVVLAAAVGLYGINSVRRITMSRDDVANRRVAPADAMPALFRDIARVIRASQPTGEVVLVSSPNSSNGIGYYGRFKTLGTLYWENNEGLKAAGRILSAPSVQEAERLIRERKVTHIAIISEENFIGPYFQLLNPTAPVENVKKTFGHQLLIDKVVPVWLRTIPYRVPEDLKSLNASVLLMQVAFDQTPADALYHIALTKIEMGDLELAERDLDELCRNVPNAPQPWLRKAEIQVAQQRWPDALASMLNGVKRAAPAEQVALYTSAAATFYRAKRPIETVGVYRAALESGFNPDVASYLGWVLATTSVDTLRNGREALEWATKALQVDSNSSTYLNTQAAALAELGRFEEAVDAVRRALAIARARNDTATMQVTEARLAAYSARQVWRE